MEKNKNIEEEIVTKLINSLLAGGKDEMRDDFYNFVKNGTIIIAKNDKKQSINSSQADKKVRITDDDIEPLRHIVNKDGLAGVVNAMNPLEEDITITPNDSNDGGIYAAEHREEAMAENGLGQMTKKVEIEQPKIRVLEKENLASDPWAGIDIAPPGTIKL